MRRIAPHVRLLALLALILVSGFTVTTVAGYASSREAIEHGLAAQALPLTGDNIYSQIQKDMLQPVFISSLMANDTFMRDWILQGEKEPAQIVRFLTEVQHKYGTITSFLVSARSQNYYHPGGILKMVREDEPRDAWFFRVRAMAAPYETNVDFDLANRDKLTIFINHRVFDYDGNFIGVTGVGLTLDTMAQLIDNYRARFERNIYFVDKGGKVVLAGKRTTHVQGDLRTLPGLGALAGDIMNGSSTPAASRYRRGDAVMLVNSRFIPELGWYLVVEQDASAEMLTLRRAFAFNLAISAAVTLLALAIMWLALKRYQRRIETLAGTDRLTGLLNRNALELVFRQTIVGYARHARPLAAILFDIDLFKRVNDGCGHLAGDQVLKQVAALARGAVRDSDVVTRWGGEEFLVLLGECNLEQALKVAETLRAAVAQHDFALPARIGAITVSLGVAQYRAHESEECFFARADTALYAAKSAGRNRVVRAASAARPDTP